MKRTIGSLLAVGAALAVASACVENKGSLQVKGVMAPPTPMAGANCTYDPQATSITLYSGLLDIALNNQYTPALLLENQMVQRGNATQLRVETSNVAVEGATVRITDATGSQITSYTTVGAGFVPASNGTTPGFGATSVTLVDANTVESLRGQIPRGTTKRLVTFTKVFGHTLGGLKIESAEFEYPVDLCNGCLVSFPADLNCTPSGTVSVSPPCVAGQDQTIDCRLCSGNPACKP
jgi:hypothetical protein